MKLRVRCSKSIEQRVLVGEESRDCRLHELSVEELYKFTVVDMFQLTYYIAAEKMSTNQ